MASNILLAAHGLTKTFRGKKILDGLDLTVLKGDIYGFLGRNGQGKTTTIRMLTGLIFPDAGSVTIGGYDLKSDFKNAISQIGAIVESPAFYDYLSGYENLSLMANLIPGIQKGKIDEVLEIVGLRKRARDKAGTYSLGMKQRLGIANALLGDPKLIILDEPTNGLDPQGMQEIEEEIIQLASEREVTFLISSHLLQNMQHICNRIGILQDGHLLVEDKIENLCDGSPDSLEKFYLNMTKEG